MEIEIDVVDKRAAVVGTPTIVCGNSGYSVKFNFDDEWAEHEEKKARFVYIQNGAVTHEDVDFTGSICEVPILSKVREVRIGAYAGNLSTTTPVTIPCELSILCKSGGAATTPTPSQYDEIIALLGGKLDTNQGAENAGKILGIGADGQVVPMDAPEGGGLSYTEKNLILSLFKNAAYTTNMSATIAQLETLWSGGDVPDIPDADVSQTGSILSIISGVTVSQSGSILEIA